MKYAVKRYWETWDEVDVEADTPAQAIEKALELPLPPDAGDAYVPDSLNSDPETDVQELKS